MLCILFCGINFFFRDYFKVLFLCYLVFWEFVLNLIFMGYLYRYREDLVIFLFFYFG